MRIVLLPMPEGDVIAREDQFGRMEGEFVVLLDGEVFYRHAWDSRLWFAGPNVAVFNEAAAAWNRYCDDATSNCTEEEQLQAVKRLRLELSRIDMLRTRDDNFWLALLDQARDGLL